MKKNRQYIRNKQRDNKLSKGVVWTLGAVMLGFTCAFPHTVYAANADYSLVQESAEQQSQSNETETTNEQQEDIQQSQSSEQQTTSSQDNQETTKKDTGSISNPPISVNKPVPVVVAPTVPKLKVKQDTYKSAKLYWNRVENAVGYKIYRSKYKNKGYKCIKTIQNKNVIYYVDKGIKKQTQYYYKIKAYNSKKASALSSPVAFKSTVKVPEFYSSRQMVKGQSFYVDLMQMTSDSKVKVKSSEPSVVQVSKKGKITAKQCGNSMVTIQIKKENFTYKMQLQIHVVYSSLYKEKETTAFTRVGKTKKRPKAAVNQQLLVGDTFKLKVTQLTKEAKVIYENANPDIVSLSDKGVVTARKKGTAKITVKVKQDGYTYTHIWNIQVKNQPSAKVSEKDIYEFLGNSVFIGDSVTVGFRNYAIAQGENFFGGAKFFCGVSFSCFNNLLPVSPTTVHPVYKGAKHTMEDAIALMKAKRAFIILGVNDMFSGIDTAYNNYMKVLENIRKKNPGIEIYVVSCTYVAKGGEKGNLNNANIREFNRRMKAYCSKTEDSTYVELGAYLVDSAGYIKAEYSSDGYVHLVHNAYKIWENVFYNQAKETLKKTKAQSMAISQAYEALATARESRLAKDCKVAKKKIKKIQNKNIRKNYLTQCNAIVLKK